MCQRLVSLLATHIDGGLSPNRSALVQAICTTNRPDFDSEALTEVRSRIEDASVLRDLAPGVRLIRTALPYSLVARVIRENPMVFVRHVCPARIWLNLATDPLRSLRGIAPWIARRLSPRHSFSVQGRVFGDAVIRRTDAVQCIASFLIAAGLELDVRKPEEVVSVQIVDADAWIGVSRVGDNISDWAGGERRFKRDGRSISRSELKLLEAIEAFKIPLPLSGRVIDLGGGMD